MKIIIKKLVIKMKLNKNAYTEYYSVRSIETKQNVFATLGSGCGTKNFNAQIFSYDKVIELLKKIPDCEGIYYQVGSHTNRKYIPIGDNEPNWL
jgi:hypothetical protein